jgi:hypothetical protein
VPSVSMVPSTMLANESKSTLRLENPSNAPRTVSPPGDSGASGSQTVEIESVFRAGIARRVERVCRIALAPMAECAVEEAPQRARAVSALAPPPPPTASPAGCHCAP